MATAIFQTDKAQALTQTQDSPFCDSLTLVMRGITLLSFALASPLQLCGASSLQGESKPNAYSYPQSERTSSEGSLLFDRRLSSKHMEQEDTFPVTQGGFVAYGGSTKTAIMIDSQEFIRFSVAVPPNSGDARNLVCDVLSESNELEIFATVLFTDFDPRGTDPCNATGESRCTVGVLGDRAGLTFAYVLNTGDSATEFDIKCGDIE